MDRQPRTLEVLVSELTRLMEAAEKHPGQMLVANWYNDLLPQEREALDQHTREVTAMVAEVIDKAKEKWEGFLNTERYQAPPIYLDADGKRVV